jgi:hypothetical protein
VVIKKQDEFTKLDSSTFLKDENKSLMMVMMTKKARKGAGGLVGGEIAYIHGSSVPVVRNKSPRSVR